MHELLEELREEVEKLKQLKKDINSIWATTLKEISYLRTEEFIDEVIGRINKKQLN